MCVSSVPLPICHQQRTRHAPHARLRASIFEHQFLGTVGRDINVLSPLSVGYGHQQRPLVGGVADIWYGSGGRFALRCIRAERSASILTLVTILNG